MPRGVRKSPLERLNEEITNTKEEINSHKSAIKTLEEKLKQLQNEIQAEEFKEISALLEEKNMTVAELKVMIASTEESPKDE